PALEYAEILKGKGGEDSAGILLFYRPVAADSLPEQPVMVLVVDSLFLRDVATRIKVLGGSVVGSFSTESPEWQDFTRHIPFFSSFASLSDDDNWSMSPFIGLFDYRQNYPQWAPIWPVGMDGQREGLNIDIDFSDEAEGGSAADSSARAGSITTFGFGRVYLPRETLSGTSAGYLVLEVGMNIVQEAGWMWLIRIGVVLLVIYAVINFLLVTQMINFGRLIHQGIVRKFEKLRGGIEEISQGNLDYKIDLEGEDEFQELAQRFNQMSDRLNQNIAELREKDRLQFELNTARTVQLSLLPEKLPEVPGYRIAADLKTATEVGGDFYDLIPLDDHRFLFTIGDVSGKGTSAALYMAQCMSLIRFGGQFTGDMAQIARRLNAFFTTSINDRQIFVTAILGILDTRRHLVEWERAGHNPPLFIPGDAQKSIHFMNSPGLGIGLTSSESLLEQGLKVNHFSFQPGDTFLSYTDGVVEASKPVSGGGGENREAFEEQDLIASVEPLRDRDPATLLQHLNARLKTFYGKSPVVDDYTLLILQRQR
ncbi:MAG TPA: SpoIIE family protein phosphatase, partial [Calditrichia bacterium]|nr:SpoIIE family protein phosphatase [Calditrichia bacterium]